MKHPIAAILALVVATSVAGAQTVGPDVIVGSLPDVSNYSAIGNFDAFSIGTTSCNLGDTPLLWIASNNQHPVIGQNLYRYMDGKFEMVGRSWLKHGFLALAGNVCSTCTGPGGSQLDPGCSDPYGSGLNGSQGGLGPRSQVDASTGAYPYPFTHGNQGSSGNSIYKRLQVHVDDLNPTLNPGAQYFVEGHYVTPDDAAAGNHHNNASYRAANITGGGTNYNMSLTGQTVRELPAIFAWQVIDPGVAINPVDDGTQGRFLVGFKANELPSGNWAWEFAVHNLNSHRSGRTFSVDVPAGAVVSNIDFHDSFYHSGDGEVVGTDYDSTDWTASVAGSTITWSTATFAANANANALRWGSLYNFRFETDLPPSGMINAAIGLYRPGAIPSISTTFSPPASFTKLTGDNQVTNTGEAFADPFTVRLTAPNGTPIVGETVNWVGTNGLLLSATSTMTDINGDATITVSTAANAQGAGTISASTANGQVVFDVFTRRLNIIWASGPGILVIQATTDVSNMPLLVAVDQPGLPAIMTPYGNVVTSIFNPLPTFFAWDGIGLFVSPDPTVKTNASGSYQQVITGLGALSGSGAQAAFQAYGIAFPVIWVSNAPTVTF